MPALLTHYLCGNAMLKSMEDDHAYDMIYNHRNVFNLGTQGPDIFFYYGAWPWVDSRRVNDFGDRMHEEKTGDFIMEAIKYAKASEAASKSILTAYICGYLCHYALDCCTHPYIFYSSGFVRKGEEHTSKYTCYHRRFETALDVLMLEHELNLKPSGFNASEQITIETAAAGIIGEMYSCVLSKVYGVNIGRELVMKAISDMGQISAVLRDRTGIKKKLLSSIEKCMRKQPMLSSMILPLKIKDGLDYLNLSHSVWFLPWDNTEPKTASFIESFEAAAGDAKQFIEAAHHFWEGSADMENLIALIGSRSFSTGLDCSLDLELKFYDCIFE